MMQRNIPHLQQSREKRNCAAACLCMLFQSYRIPGRMNDVTSEISVILPDGFPSCRNNLILKYLLSRNIPCCIVAALDIKTLIAQCFKSNIDVIISYLPYLPALHGHYSVVTAYNDRHILINDPEKDPSTGFNKPVEFDALAEMMNAHFEIPFNPINREVIRDNTAILVANPHLNIPAKRFEVMRNGVLYGTPVFQNVEPYISAVVVPDEHDGFWTPFSPA